MTTQQFAIRIEVYHYNSGAADNGTRTHTQRYNTIKEAQYQYDLIKLGIELNDTRFLFDEMRLGWDGFISSVEGPFLVTHTEELVSDQD